MQIHLRPEIQKFSKIVLVGIAVISFCVSPASADDLSVTLGLKARLNNLNASVANSSVVFDDSDSWALLLGPSLKLAYKKFFTGVTWLQTAGRRYSFDYYSVGFNEPRSMDISMSEIDVLAGYMFHPRFGAFVGYKSISSEATPIADSPTTSQFYDLAIKGPAVGVTGNVPLGKLPMLAVASASYLAIDEYTFAPTDPKKNGSGYSLEIGVTYDPWENIVLYLGLKHQKYEADIGDEWKAFGLTISGDYRF